MANGSSATAEEIGRTHGTDQGVLAALMAIHMPGPEEIAAVNLKLSQRPECDPERVAWLHGIMVEEWLSPRLDLVTFLDSMDTDRSRDREEILREVGLVRRKRGVLTPKPVGEPEEHEE